ncbi:ABC transporter ATP-binding protein/permease [Antarctobacter heliothermus]|uniref:ATP-binding cassette, subfamily C, CydD n=1 Tax=Antarctobacter heliothermus TaxID=74033 RepID=A0A239DFZ3_9RHOB|nr:ATP-binding cassette domain-containing protein [Antarctobacter heliothermus]SNS30811.1 ATP-binding cassette, subfamily C, CydD [Antarctobacter heliothermus]
MTRPGTQDKNSPKQRAKDRIIAPVSRDLNRAGWLAVLAGMLWPVQAAVIAWTISGWVAGTQDLGGTILAAALFAALGGLRAILDHRSGAFLFRAADKTVARERAAILRREARRPAGTGSASIAALTVQKVPVLQPWITRYHVAMVRVSVLPVLFLLLSFSLSWVVGLTLLVAGPLIPVFMALVGMAAEDASRKQMVEIGAMNNMLLDQLSAMTDIRLLGATDRAAKDFETRAEGLRERTMAVLRIAFLSSTVLELFAALGVAMVAVFVGFTLLGEVTFGSWGTPLTVGEGIFLLLIAPEFFQPLRDLATAWHDRAAGYAVVEELDALDRAERAELVGHGERAAPLDGVFHLRSTGAVASLPGRQIRLPDLSLDAGETLALTGPSGAGKSTALAAIAGLVPLASGRIEVCGQPLGADTADAWRARIAMIPQRVHFPDIALCDWLSPQGADPGPALDMAEATGIVAPLPDGLKTRLGETGGGISGGEARRLMVARAILAGGDLILADEPTADLDDVTADRVIAALLRLNADGHTVIVATHDPRLAKAMGRRVEVGA